MSDAQYSADFVSRLLPLNRNWAERLNQTFPRYFPNPATHQRPKLLWVGCSDSRVQDSDLTTALPGEIFVHRNIANQFHSNDDNVLSVFVYAITALHVREVVIVGHDHCGGAISALHSVRPLSQKVDPKERLILCDSYHEHENEPTDAQHEEAASAESPTTRWLAQLVARVRRLEQEGKLPHDFQQAVRVVIEENVKLQIENMALPAVTRWIPAGEAITVHGWVYDFSTGFARQVVESRTLRRA